MGFSRVTCVAAVCEGCGPHWWHSTADAAPLFESPALARKALADEYGWRIEREHTTGRVRMLCPQCAVRDHCDVYGHDWPKLADGRLACCLRCSRVRRDDAPPPGHPDTAVGEVPSWLADLESELFEGSREVSQ